MSTVWRISNYADLSGIGGLHSPGRWHPLGNPIVYLSEHPALALLEVMVHLEIDREDLPDTFQLLKVDVPDAMLQRTSQVLPENWQDDEDITQRLGLEWLRSNASALLSVPSAILPESTNILLNPLHPDAAKISITEVVPFSFDDRLLG
jgi:RES domain-containing protein